MTNTPITPESPQPPPQPQYAPPTQTPSQPVGPAKGLALSALIVGIVAFLMGLLPVVGAIVGATAVVLGAIALNKKQPKGLAVTGLVLGAVGLLASISVTAGLGALSSQVETIENETAAEEPVKSETPSPEPEPAPEPEPEPVVPSVPQQTFTGVGDFVQPVNISDVAYVTFACADCSSNTVLKSDGPESLLVNTIGAYSGSHFINLRTNSLTSMFEIKATGNWTLTVGPIDDAAVFDGVASGRGDTAFKMNGPGKIAQITNVGESNFVVQVYGNRTDLAVNTIGSYSGVVPFEMPSFVQVTSSGDWSITPQ